MASKLFGMSVVLAIVGFMPAARAGDPFGAARTGLPSLEPRPFPGAPIAEIAPYLNSHPAGSAPDFSSGPSTFDDYRYLRTAPATPDIALYRLVVREPAVLPSLPVIPAPLEPRPLLDVESCSADWFAMNACVLRLYTGDARR